MVSLSSYTEYYSALKDFNNYYGYSSRSGTAGSRTIDGFYHQTYPTGTAPTIYTSATPRTMSKNDVGAIPIPTPYSGGTLRILGYSNSTTSISNVVFVFDRLVEVNNISANTTSAQTITTGTLPRFTGGTKVFCFLEPGTSLAGGTEVTATVTYTNQDGVSGRTGTCLIGGGNFGAINAARFIRLAVGDSGVRSVESVQLSANSVAGTSRINLVLARFIGMFFNSGLMMNSTSSFANLINGNMVGGLAEIDSNACLFMVRGIYNLSGYNDGTTMGNLIIKESYEI